MSKDIKDKKFEEIYNMIKDINKYNRKFKNKILQDVKKPDKDMV